MRVYGITAVLILFACAAGADSLFTREAAKSGNLVSNKNVEFKEGDIINVIVQETIDATTQANTDTKKESDIGAKASAADNTFLLADKPKGLGLLNEELLPNWAIEAENEHKADGQTKRASRLTTTIGCTVVKVHENGNLDIQGTKRVSVNREDSELFVRGTIRGRDVTSANTVSSRQLANAEIALRGRGPLWNNQRRGLLSKVLDWFSPF